MNSAGCEAILGAHIPVAAGTDDGDETAMTSTPGTLTERRAEMRRSILRAAEALFTEWGYVGVTPADVSADVGIGRTTFYEYFTDMEDLLAALVEERLPEVTEQILAAIPRDLSSREQLTELALRMVEFAVTDHVLGLELHQGLPALSSATQDRIGAAHRRLSGEFGRIYGEGVRSGDFRALSHDLAAVLLSDTILAAAKALMKMDDPTERLDEIGNELIVFLFEGLSEKPVAKNQ